MATWAQLRSRVGRLVRDARGDLDLVWGQIADQPELVDVLLEMLPGLLDTYGSAIAATAADWYDEARAEREIRGSFRAIPAVNHKLGIPELVGWAGATGTTPETFQTLLWGGLERRLANFSRDTIIGSSVADPQALGWMRVAGLTACAFCRMLASRGAVYTDATVRFGAHDHDNCQASPKWGTGADVFDVQEYRRSVRRAGMSEERRAADDERARDWIAKNLPT